MASGRASRGALLLVGLALVATACGGSGGGGTTTGGSTTKGTRGGTLRILSNADVDFLDTADSYSTFGFGLERGYARTLYSYDITKTGDAAATPVPDLADGSAQATGNNTVFTFKLRQGVRYAPPVSRAVRPEDFVTAVERMFDKATPSGGQGYARLIKGAAAFGEGKAKTISGLAAKGDTLTVTLDKPAPDFLSVVAMPFFAPVPKEYASKYKVGNEYSKHVVGSGPYTLKSYIPSKSMEFVRNTNWDPATDPLRKAWVDSITVREGLAPDAIQQTIERGDADLSWDSNPPNARLQRLASDPKLKQQFADPVTGCARYFSLGMTAGSGPTANLKVRQAINLAVDKVALQRARGGPFAGEIASTVLPPTLLGYARYDLYPTPNSQGDPARARQLLAEAGYPQGVTIGYAGADAGAGQRVNVALQASLARAGITLKIKQYPGFSLFTDSLGLPAKRAEHAIGQANWCPDYPGDGTRSWFVPLLDGRSIQPANNNNYGEYNNPRVNSMIDQALTEPDKTRRAQLWSQADRQVMQDAAWVPYIYDKTPYFWSARVRNWTWTAWSNQPDLTSMWLQPNTP
jgi:ABC-type transport system substrate-binding protein